LGAAEYAIALWSASVYPAASSMESLAAWSLPCSVSSPNRSSRQMPVSGITWSPSLMAERLAVARYRSACRTTAAFGLGDVVGRACPLRGRPLLIVEPLEPGLRSLGHRRRGLAGCGHISQPC